PSSVFDIQIENINTTAVSLRWKINDTVASEYTYRILVEGNGTTSEVITNTSATNTVIAGLEPGTLYNFTIFSQVADKKTEGDPFSRSKYTSNPVFDIQIENISTTAVNVSWNAGDRTASEYTYRILVEGNTSEVNKTTNATNIVIVGLEPGTSYNFTIYSRIADGRTEGVPVCKRVYTSKFLSHIDFFHEKYAFYSLYSSESLLRSGGAVHGNSKNYGSHSPRCSEPDLAPGPHVCFSSLPIADKDSGKDQTRESPDHSGPSPVFGFEVVNISTTEVTLTWETNDTASYGYTYVIYTFKDFFDNVTTRFLKVTIATINNLSPGTHYTFTVIPRAEDNKTEGSPVNTSSCTCKSHKCVCVCMLGFTIPRLFPHVLLPNPASVSSFNCEPVAKQKILTLQWDCPTGKNSGFKVNFSNGSWHRETEFLPCNTGRQATNSTNLDYFTTYNISIATLSCGKESFPKQATCATSITDPPAPVELPTIISTSHNSLQVQFNEFQSTNGPLEAYAVIITTDSGGGAKPSKDCLFTYDDFRKKTTKTYVTFVKKVGQKRVSSSSPEEIVVGDGDVTYGYYNGKLDPLGSYRVCVAGFTNIVFSNNNTGPIAEDRSYVAYTHYSMLVSLPQDPGVITGAVVGCLLAAIVIAAVVGFIFWKRRRSKLVKVENFETYFKKQQADSNCGFAEEYEELRSVGVNQPKFAAELPENKGKNRYNNVLPYDISRVKLLIQDHPSEDYINANYMPGYNSRREFIAAQGPLPNTMEDFWRMIWEKDICGVVMLTKCVEQGRTKCEEYWPSKHSKRYGDIIVAMTSEIVLPEWTIRDFSVEKSNSTESHAVRQFHFTAWPDHGVPETTDLLSNFRYLVHEYMKQNPPTSLLVHCSAGVGRTGTFISIDRLIHQMEMENMVDVYGVVYDLRMHRPLMVQTEDQYIFLNQCVLDIIRSQKDKQSDLIYQNTNAMAIYENFTPSPDFRKTNGYHV
uniref:Receptor-type tyrosine-protein phosphatase eta n=1 Tax=Sphenodon punctatus TaxID=8508 RepID=A0A8D0L2V8_SPHPU